MNTQTGGLQPWDIDFLRREQEYETLMQRHRRFSMGEYIAKYDTSMTVCRYCHGTGAVKKP